MTTQTFQVQRVNIYVPAIDKCQVGFAQNIGDGNYKVKTIHGILDAKKENLTFFESIVLTTKYFVHTPLCGL